MWLGPEDFPPRALAEAIETSGLHIPLVDAPIARPFAGRRPGE